MRDGAAAARRLLGRLAAAPEALSGAVHDAARRQHAGLGHTAHRPWPLPAGPWVMGQSWLDVLFLHWPVPAERLRALVGPQLEIDRFEGRAWVSVTPFEVVAARPRAVPPLPGLSRFPELNVRTYVTLRGRPGIFFFSLDAGSAAAVAGARAAYRLPYFRARMRVARDGRAIEYGSERDDPRGAPAALSARWAPAGASSPAAPGSLDAWLVERYRLYTVDRGRVLFADIHHAPWSIGPADLRLGVNTMLAPLGIEPPGAPLVHVSPRQDVVVWAPRVASRG
jgi:uncharacterized protein